MLGIWGDKGTRVVASESMWREPLKWDREAREAGERRRVFCSSLADVFEQRAELNAPRRRLAKLIWGTPHLDWLFLTKRIEYAETTLYDMWAEDAEWPRNFWVGTSVEDQQRADERIPHLMEIYGTVRFLSIEPLLGPIDLREAGAFGLSAETCNRRRDHGSGRCNCLRPVDWVIVGGESGRNARPCDLAWIRSIRDQCKAAGVPVFVKQLGAKPTELGIGLKDIPSGRYLQPIRRELNLADPKGGDESEWPEDLRGFREFPR